MRESFSLSPNSRMVYADGRRMLNPSLIRRYISPCTKEVISWVQAEACAPLDREVSSAWGDHGGPVWAGMNSST